MADPQIHQLRAAMRVALGKALVGIEVPDPVLNGIEDAIEDLGEAIDFVVENPCTCERGRACPYRGLPPGDADTGHCQQCGAHMPGDPSAANGDSVACPGCGAAYVIGEEEPLR